MLKSGISTVFIFCILCLWGIPSFSNDSCKQSIQHLKNKIISQKIVLQGSHWPAGAKEKFTLMEFNFLDLIGLDKALKNEPGARQLPKGYRYFAKPLYQLQGAARILKKYPPDILFGVEIGSLQVLRDYDNDFLGDRFEELFIEGNDPRGIHLGMLVRKDLPLEVELQSHKNWFDEKTKELVFSRDLPAYLFKEKGKSQPFLIVFGTHFKSQRDADGDPRGFKKRSLQVEFASQIIADYQNRYVGVPILLTGDFNNDVRQAPEFEPLRRLGLIDAFELAPEGVPYQDRGTHYYFPKKGVPTVSQLDAVLFNSAAQSKNWLRRAQILRHIDPEGHDYPPPHSYKERQARASDHSPVWIEMDLSGE